MADPVLSEDRRKQLDGIVSQMEANGEPSENIQFVVDDFKKKYATSAQPEAAPSLMQRVENFSQGVRDVQTGILKAGVNSLPAIGGTVGGIVGGIGGTVGGVGVGGVPGSIGGAAVGGAGGEAARQLINRAAGWDAGPSSATDAAMAIGTEGAIQGGLEGLGKGFGAGMAKAAPWLMEKAVKPTTALLKEYRTTGPAIVKTLLDEGINVTEGGVMKLQKLFNENNQQIKEALENRDNLLRRLSPTGDSAVVDKSRVAARVLPTANRLAQQTNPTKDLKAVGDTVTEFMNHPTMPGNLTLPEAQAMKIGTYQQIGKKYGQISSAEVEAQKALARGLKEEIASEVPQISALNKADSELMAALDAVGRQAALSARKDPVGFAWAAHHPTTFIAALIDRSPAVKSFLARGMYKQAALVGNVSPLTLRAALAAISQSSEASPDGELPQK